MQIKLEGPEVARVLELAILQVLKEQGTSTLSKEIMAQLEQPLKQTKPEVVWPLRDTVRIASSMIEEHMRANADLKALIASVIQDAIQLLRDKQTRLAGNVADKILRAFYD